MADGCEEIELVTIIDILRRSATRVTVAGLNGDPVTGSRRIKFLPDESLAHLHEKDFDAIIFPGGGLGVDKLRADQRVLEFVRKMDERGALIGAICAAPLILQDAGIIRGRRLTSYPGFEKKLQGCHYSKQSVVVDGNLVTSRAPGTAMAFALKLVEILVGKKRSREVAKLALVG